MGIKKDASRIYSSELWITIEINDLRVMFIQFCGREWFKAKLIIGQFQRTTLGILFILLSLINHMHWDLYTYISQYYELT